MPSPYKSKRVNSSRCWGLAAAGRPLPCGFTPNKAAQDLLSDDYYALMRDGGMLPDEETFQRLHWIERGPGTEIFNDTWTAVKAQ